MISEGSYDWSNDFITGINYISKYIQMKSCYNNSQYYYLYFILIKYIREIIYYIHYYTLYRYTFKKSYQPKLLCMSRYLWQFLAMYIWGKQFRLLCHLKINIQSQAETCHKVACYSLVSTNTHTYYSSYWRFEFMSFQNVLWNVFESESWGGIVRKKWVCSN